MGRWVRLVWLLAVLGAVGVLVVHYQTSVVASGYEFSNLLQERERLKERNRMLRIELGRAGNPGQVRKSWEALSADEAGAKSEPQGNAEAPGKEEEDPGRE
jgi:hypothetical protein